ncbi:hypothetical protein CBL_04943 [Carabus blaptoides fortunei]
MAFGIAWVLVASVNNATADERLRKAGRNPVTISFQCKYGGFPVLPEVQMVWSGAKTRLKMNQHNRIFQYKPIYLPRMFCLTVTSCMQLQKNYARKQIEELLCMAPPTCDVCIYKPNIGQYRGQWNACAAPVPPVRSSCERFISPSDGGGAI